MSPLIDRNKHRSICRALTFLLFNVMHCFLLNKLKDIFEKVNSDLVEKKDEEIL